MTRLELLQRARAHAQSHLDAQRRGGVDPMRAEKIERFEEALAACDVLIELINVTGIGVEDAAPEKRFG